MVKERIIGSIVALIFGVVITLAAVFTGANVAIIVLGGLLTAIGVGCLVWALVDAKKAKAVPVAVVPTTDTVDAPKKTTTTKKTTTNKAK